MSRGGRVLAPHLAGTPPADPRHTVGIDDAGETPILREYRAVKAGFPEAIVLARLGDFYEMFGPDAEVAAPILGIALTGRNFGNAGRLPMCGVPQQTAVQYIRRLLDAGKRVALWDQVGDVEAGRLVRRAVTRVLSAGTVLEDEYLHPAAVSRCVAVSPGAGRVGVAALDVSTGHLELSELAGGLDTPALAETLQRLDAAELLTPEDSALPQRLLPHAARTELPAALFDTARADERLRLLTGTVSAQGLGIDRVPVARAAAGAVLAYCERARVVLTPELLRIEVHEPRSTMRLDAQTVRNLELFVPLGEHGLSIMSLLDRTRTPMGARRLRAFLYEPLIDVDAIAARAAVVETMVRARDSRRGLREALTRVRDIERLVSRCVQGTATPRDLAAVRDTCAALPDVQAAAEAIGDAAVSASARRCRAPDELLTHLTALLVDDPPATARDGGAVRPGADGELDDLLTAGADARGFIGALEPRERERTGIRSLRLGYNRVFGYYIDIPNAQQGNVPADYIRKQTLAGSERYVTADLKAQETFVLHAHERAVAREQALLHAAMIMVGAHAADIAEAAGALAGLDVTQALATVADEGAWVRPRVDASGVIDIVEGRHPLVEEALGPGRFVANACRLDDAARIIVLTGPNMAGKSTYLRQVGIIVLLAQIGSFVPAAEARIGVCDRVFTRIGAQDDLSGGMSTFMVEMAETAAILRQATGRSLVILDEIGRGTSTYDGMSIARAVIEHLHDAPHLNCRTLFATHYHELTALAERLSRVRNARVEVVEEGDSVTFLHRIVDGGADRSFGIHVARLAGVPASVLVRARDLLAELERSRPLMQRAVRDADQLTLAISEPAAHPVVEELAGLDLDALSPLAALNKLAELHERAAT